MAYATLPRDEMVRRLMGVFRAHGYEGASLAKLSQATGLVKASLYHAFPGGKEAMAEAVLSAIAAAVDARALAPLSGPGEPKARLEAMLRGLGELYEGGEAACLFSLFSVGEAGPRFAGHVRRSMAAIQAAIAGVLEEAGFSPEESAMRGEDALIAIQGALALARITGGTRPFARTMAALPARLLAPAGRG